MKQRVSPERCLTSIWTVELTSPAKIKTVSLVQD